MTEEAREETPRKRLWAEYWAEAGPSSCTDLLPPAAKAQVDARWSAAIRALPDGSALLDIGAGKGALLRLAQRCRPDRARGLSLTGVDIVPEEALLQDTPQGAVLMGGIDAAKLPFADEAFDLVVSQFGIEYAALDGALSEACRVCRHRFLFLMHRKGGAVAAEGSEEGRTARFILDEIALFAHLDHWLDERSDAAADRLSQALSRLEERARMQGNPRLAATIHKAVCDLANAAPAASSEGRRIGRDMARRLDNHAARMTALEAAASQTEDMATRVAALPEADAFTIAVEEAVSPDGTAYALWASGERKSVAHDD